MAHTNANTAIEQAEQLLSTLTAEIDFARQRNSVIKQNAEQGFATISEQHNEQNDATQFVIYNAHLAKTQFLTALHINLNSDEQQAIEQGVKHRSDSNNKHNITQKANSVIEQLDAQNKLTAFNIRMSK